MIGWQRVAQRIPGGQAPDGLRARAIGLNQGPARARCYEASVVQWWRWCWYWRWCCSRCFGVAVAFFCLALVSSLIGWQRLAQRIPGGQAPDGLRARAIGLNQGPARAWCYEASVAQWWRWCWCWRWCCSRCSSVAVTFFCLALVRVLYPSQSG